MHTNVLHPRTHARTHTHTDTHTHTHAHTPQDGHQLLEAVEDVHFQLFIALVLHLAAVTLAIHRIVKLQRSLHTFESTLRRRRSAARRQRARETARLVGTEPRSHSALTAIHTHRHTEEEDDDDPAADGDLNGDARVVARRSLSAPVTVELPPEERKQSSTSLDRAFTHSPTVGPSRATRRVWHRADMSMVMKAPRRVLGLTQDGYGSLRRRLLQHLVARPLDEVSDMDAAFVCVCVGGVVWGGRVCLCVHVCVRVYVYMCVCVCASLLESVCANSPPRLAASLSVFGMPHVS